MEASNSVVKEVKKKILETEKFKIINHVDDPTLIT